MVVLSMFLFCSCKGEEKAAGTELEPGIYTTEEMESGLAPYLRINEDETASFTYSPLSSELPMGSYTIEDGRFILTDDELDKEYSFKVDGSNLIFDADQSSEIPVIDGNTVPDGLRFTYSEESAQ